jgi:alpha-glucosidase
MKRFLSGVVLLFVLGLQLQAQTIIPETRQKLVSPDGAYVFEFYQKQFSDSNKQMYYTLNFKGKTVVLESELGVLIENNTFESALGVPNDTCKIWGENLSFTGSKRDTVNKTWTPVYGEHSSIRNNYNELTTKFSKRRITSVQP